MFIDQASFRPLVAALEAAGARNRALAQNIANLNTPAYQRVDVDFSGAVQRALGGEETLRLQTTNPRHLAGGRSGEGQPLARRDSAGASSSVRPDGNNVDLEREMVNLVENAFTYQSTVQQLNARLGMLRYAIEGRR